nr:FecR family protein [bacterium]
MNPIRRLFQLFLTAALVGVTGLAAMPQTANEKEFKPRVARIAYIEGPVTTQRTTDDEWSDATLNLPLLVGDKLYTGAGGRAEVQLEDGIVLRLAGDTYIHFANLEDTMIRVGLLKGALDVNATKVAYTRTPIEVQSNTFQAGIYDWGNVRFDADEAGNTVIMVKRGSVDIAKGAKDLLSLKRGQQARINAADPNNPIVEKIRQEDDFDQWCHMRDAMLAASRDSQYINTRVAGYSDLDRYGSWVEIPEYGRVWRPAVVVDTWAPYRDGRWVWRDYCGWTWVSYEPWGWVPYHYGRWVYANGYNWCWVPGPDVYVTHYRPYYYSRPLWWPALVSFSYSHHGRYYSFAFGSGGYYNNYPCVGWFPLGPHDPYPYYYHHHYGYTRIKYENNSTYIDNSVHIDNSTNYYDYSTHNYQNVNAPNAVTVMNKRDFDNGDYSKKAIASLNPSEIRNVTVGPEAAVQISPRRAVETKPERGMAGADMNTTALPAGSEPANAARNGQAGRDVAAVRGNALAPDAGTSPAAVEPGRGQGGNAPRSEGNNGQSPASLSPRSRCPPPRTST